MACIWPAAHLAIGRLHSDARARAICRRYRRCIVSQSLSVWQGPHSQGAPRGPRPCWQLASSPTSRLTHLQLQHVRTSQTERKKELITTQLQCRKCELETLPLLWHTATWLQGPEQGTHSPPLWCLATMAREHCKISRARARAIVWQPIDHRPTPPAALQLGMLCLRKESVLWPARMRASSSQQTFSNLFSTKSSTPRGGPGRSQASRGCRSFLRVGWFE